MPTLKINGKVLKFPYTREGVMAAVAEAKKRGLEKQLVLSPDPKYAALRQLAARLLAGKKAKSHGAPPGPASPSFPPSVNASWPLRVVSLNPLIVENPAGKQFSPRAISGFRSAGTTPKTGGPFHALPKPSGSKSKGLSRQAAAKILAMVKAGKMTEKEALAMIMENRKSKDEFPISFVVPSGIGAPIRMITPGGGQGTVVDWPGYLQNPEGHPLESTIRLGAYTEAEGNFPVQSKRHSASKSRRRMTHPITFQIPSGVGPPIRMFTAGGGQGKVVDWPGYGQNPKGHPLSNTLKLGVYREGSRHFPIKGKRAAASKLRGVRRGPRKGLDKK